MSPAIPDFTERIAPLRMLLEEAHRRSGSRKKRSIKKFSLLLLGRGPQHELAFNDLQQTLRNAVRLGHRDKTQQLCIFIDASDRYWAGIAMQCEKFELSKVTSQQRHTPSAFLSGEFSVPELAWTTYEKEGSAIMRTFKRLDYNASLRGAEDIHRSSQFTFLFCAWCNFFCHKIKIFNTNLK